MTDTKRWLDELPLGSQERELLLVGKAARPAAGAIEANWKALSAALGTTAAISGTFATSAAANSAAMSASSSAKVGSALTASKVAGTGLSLVVAKSLAIGLSVGFAVMGVATVAEHASDRGGRPTVETSTRQAPNAHRSVAAALPKPASAPPDAARVEPPTSSSATPALSRPREPGTGPSPGLNSAAAPSAVSAVSPISAEEKTASLARQARELAELKRLIDSGAPSEALRRLDKDFSAGTPSVLSEERDALYVQGLARAHHRERALTFARQFLIHYPHSPYAETMRQLLTQE